MVTMGHHAPAKVTEFEGSNLVRKSSGKGKVVDIKTGAELMAKKEDNQAKIDLPEFVGDLILAKNVLAEYKIKLVSGSARDASSEELAKIKEMIREQEAKIAEVKSKMDAMKEKAKLQESAQAGEDMNKAKPGKENEGAKKTAPVRQLSNSAAKLANQRGASRRA